ncbi:hypothetical protein PENFLA_c007G04178 [Penicillium flavigenum]|uniref:Uncharacterized protein n=1 Tax=Penicillium flavigenum TaxID=254877 RepID=A0A1V6TIC9_9EURO|nr:hypothetical protein PENFLA_c007G04178 [Penicillium flavigenum]
MLKNAVQNDVKKSRLDTSIRSSPRRSVSPREPTKDHSSPKRKQQTESPSKNSKTELQDWKKVTNNQIAAYPELVDWMDRYPHEAITKYYYAARKLAKLNARTLQPEQDLPKDLRGKEGSGSH